MTERRDRDFPRAAVYGAAALFAFALLTALGSRMTGVGQTRMPPPVNAVDRVEFVAEDREGSVVIRDAADGSVIEVFAPGTNGFVRSVLRGFARERRMRDIGEEPPFHLTRWSDGRLTLADPSTGREVFLGAFGPANAQSFARLMTASTEPPEPQL